VRSLLEEGHLAGLVGASAAGRDVLLGALDAASERTAVLVHGPRGSGKRAVARAIHVLSARPGPLGHLPSASLQPHEQHDRLFERADDGPPLWQTCADGTLILADVDALAESVQHRLIRELDSGRGPRLVALTRYGRGATDLLPELTWRLSLRVMDLPRLRDRSVDIELIALHHLRSLGPDAEGRPWRLTNQAVHALRRHDWPGNVRELHRVLDRATHRAERGPLRVVHLGLERPPAVSVTTPLAEVERQVVEQALDELGGNVTEVGRRLGIPRSTLYRKLKRWGMK